MLVSTLSIDARSRITIRSMGKARDEDDSFYIIKEGKWSLELEVYTVWDVLTTFLVAHKEEGSLPLIPEVPSSPSILVFLFKIK